MTRRRSLLLVLAIALSSACGGIRPPRPPQPPTVPHWTLDMQVSGDHGGIAGADLKILDGPNANRTATTGPTGEVKLRDLEQSGFTICAHAETYKDNCLGVTLTSDQNQTIMLARAVDVRHGLVRPDGAALRDDDGFRLFIGASLFWAPRAYVDEPARLDSNLTWLKERGADFIRVLVSVGTPTDPFWSCCRLNIKSPQWPAQLAGLVDHAYELGLRVQLTIFGDTLATSKQEREGIVDAVGALVQARPERIFAVEIANEGFDNFPDKSEARALATRLAGQIRNLIAVTAPGKPSCTTEDAGCFCSEIEKWYGGNVGSLVTYHFERSWNGSGGAWRPVRQPWRGAVFSCPGTARVWSSNEPIGPTSSVQADSDPTRRGALAGVTWVSSIPVDVWHTGSGVRGVVDPVRHRPANVYEEENADAGLRAMAAVRALLPQDLPNWQRSGSSPSTLGLFAPDFNAVDRIYCDKQGATAYCTAENIHAPARNTTMRAMHLEVYSALDGHKLQDLNLSSGQTFTLDPATPAAILAIH